jgi:hypothetical protein
VLEKHNTQPSSPVRLPHLRSLFVCLKGSSRWGRLVKGGEKESGDGGDRAGGNSRLESRGGLGMGGNIVDGQGEEEGLGDCAWLNLQGLHRCLPGMG